MESRLDHLVFVVLGSSVLEHLTLLTPRTFMFIILFSNNVMRLFCFKNKDLTFPVSINCILLLWDCSYFSLWETLAPLDHLRIEVDITFIEVDRICYFLSLVLG